MRRFVAAHVHPTPARPSDRITLQSRREQQVSRFVTAVAESTRDQRPGLAEAHPNVRIVGVGHRLPQSVPCEGSRVCTEDPVLEAAPGACNESPGQEGPDGRKHSSGPSEAPVASIPLLDTIGDVPDHVCRQRQQQSVDEDQTPRTAEPDRRAAVARRSSGGPGRATKSRPGARNRRTTATAGRVEGRGRAAEYPRPSGYKRMFEPVRPSWLGGRRRGRRGSPRW